MIGMEKYINDVWIHFIWNNIENDENKDEEFENLLYIIIYDN